mmetsp:Transcript_28325/g.68846  ORF Transcript_28325/g.68846 Transcript_28325/m.68846 type:complete len:125 (+) Transcript_28325:463-837(+)
MHSSLLNDQIFFITIFITIKARMQIWSIEQLNSKIDTKFSQHSSSTMIGQMQIAFEGSSGSIRSNARSTGGSSGRIGGSGDSSVCGRRTATVTSSSSSGSGGGDVLSTAERGGVKKKKVRKAKS